jgi:hypothetical protein
MTLLIKLISATALVLAVYSSAHAAKLTSVAGVVQANSGNGFVAAPVSTELKPGDQVMVGAQGSGVITYGNGCSVHVKAGEVVTVTDDAGCKPNALETGSNAAPIAATSVAEIGVGTIALGVAVVGGAAFALTLANKKSPSSP